MDRPSITFVSQLVFPEGILSIDNAAGARCTAALRVGLFGAYVGRGMMLFLASLLIDHPWLRLVGAAYLIRLAFAELGDLTPSEETEEEKYKALDPSF